MEEGVGGGGEVARWGGGDGECERRGRGGERRRKTRGEASGMGGGRVRQCGLG